jgi:hypothetical protein
MPSQVSSAKSATKAQKASRASGRNWLPRRRLVSVHGSVSSTSMQLSIAITPPSLLGTLRSTAYAKVRYHSGTIEGGVCIGAH